MVQTDENQQQILEHLPYIQMVCAHVADISQAIRHGETGEEELNNLLTDLPAQWLDDIKDKMMEIDKEATSSEKKLWQEFNNNRCTVNERNYRITQNRRTAVRNIKQLVVGMLDEKGLLFISKTSVPESNVSFKDEEI